MPYGNDATVYVEDTAGDLGANPSPLPFWLSPDVDIPAHSGQAVQGSNDVRIRVHAHEEPILSVKIVAEVYVGLPSLAMSPSVGTVRIDPGNLRFRTADVAGTEPVASVAGGELTFPWTPSSSGQIDGPGHRCLVLRAFPEDVTPPTDPFDVPNEPHEAQHNIEILATTMASAQMSEGGAGTPDDPRHRDKETGLWWERLATVAGSRKGKRFVVFAFDPHPSEELAAGLRHALEKSGVKGFSAEPPDALELDAGKGSRPIDPQALLKRRFRHETGLGHGLWEPDRLLAAAGLDLAPNRLAHLLVRFDHSNLERGTALVLHGAQWSARGELEGGITIVVPPAVDAR